VLSPPKSTQVRFYSISPFAILMSDFSFSVLQLLSFYCVGQAILMSSCTVIISTKSVHISGLQAGFVVARNF
jgi:hypothetical protein